MSYNCQPDPDGRGTHDSKSSIQSHPHSREITTICTELEGNYHRSVGAELHTGLLNRLHPPAQSAPSSKRACLLQGGDQSPYRGGGEDANQKGSSTCPQGTRSQRLPVTAVHYTQKRWGHETHSQPKEPELLCRNSALQNGGDPNGQRHSQTRRLDDKGRPERCILYDPYCNPPKAPLALSMAGDNIPVQLPPLRTVVSPLGLYQDHEANSGDPQDTGSEVDHLHRRHPYHGRYNAHCQGAHSSADLPPRKPGFHNQLPQIPLGANTGNRISGLHTELTVNGDQSSWQQNQTNPLGGKETPRHRSMQSSCSVSFTGETQSCVPGNSPCTTVLQEPAIVPPGSPGSKGGEGLLSSCTLDTSSQGGADLVAGTPYQLEWAGSIITSPRLSNRD